MAELPELTEIRRSAKDIQQLVERHAPIMAIAVNAQLNAILTAAERMAGEREKLIDYVAALEDELEDYHPADLQPVVTRTEIINRCRTKHGITDHLMVALNFPAK